VAALQIGCADTEDEVQVGTRAVTGLEACTTRLAGYHHIAAVLPFEGSWPVGEPTEHAILQAILEVNRQGGIGGRSLGLVVCNTRGDAEIASKVTSEIARAQPVSAIIGPMGSDALEASARVAAEQGIVLISPGCGGVSSDPAWVKHLGPSVDSEALVMNKILERQGIGSALVIHPDNPDANALNQRFHNLFAGSGHTAGHVSYRTDLPDFAMNAVTAAMIYGPLAVVLVAAPADGAAILRAASNRSFRPRWLFSPQLRSPRFAQAVGNTAVLEGAWGLGAADPTRATGHVFTAKFAEAWGSVPEPFGAEAYDAVYLLAIAMTLAQDADDRSQVRERLDYTATGEAVQPGEWTLALEQASAGTMNYDGVSGPVDLDASGGVSLNLEQWTYSAGTFQTLACFTPDAQPCE
jgi:branched-chain amino acid transport system substrate-binding protein